MTSKIHQCLLFVSSALLLVVFQISVWGQSAANSGQISGQVLDSSGLAVPGLEVSARNKDTNLIRTTITDEAGRYAIGPLPLGNYQVTLKPANLEEATQDVYVSLGGRRRLLRFAAICLLLSGIVAISRGVYALAAPAGEGVCPACAAAGR